MQCIYEGLCGTYDKYELTGVAYKWGKYKVSRGKVVWSIWSDSPRCWAPCDKVDNKIIPNWNSFSSQSWSPSLSPEPPLGSFLWQKYSKHSTKTIGSSVFILLLLVMMMMWVKDWEDVEIYPPIEMVFRQDIGDLHKCVCFGSKWKCIEWKICPPPNLSKKDWSWSNQMKRKKRRK